MKLLVLNGLKMDVVGEELICSEGVKEKIYSSYYFYMLKNIIVFPELYWDNKFVVMREKRDYKEYLVDFFLSNIFHVDTARHLVDDGFDFVGAGKWKFMREEGKEKIDIFNFDVWFDSLSCREEYGFDRPKEKEVQNEIIGNIKNVLASLLTVINERVKAEKAELGIK